jgi:hypothetical protein
LVSDANGDALSLDSRAFCGTELCARRDRRHCRTHRGCFWSYVG